MTNFEIVRKECEDYWKENYLKDHESRKILHDMGYEPNSLTWGMTSYESFLEVILQVKKPKRFVVFGSSIGYQLFFWNNIFPDIPCVGVEVMKYRVNWSRSIIDKYLIKNVEILHNDIEMFQVRDGDLIWQNNLLFDDEWVLCKTNEILKNYDVETISYVRLGESVNEKMNIVDKNKNIKTIDVSEFKIETSWVEEKINLYYYHFIDNNNVYNVDFLNKEFIIPEKCLKDYSSMNSSKKFVISEKLKEYTNKFNLKQKFKEIGFNTPETYLYTEVQKNIISDLENLKTFVVKPAHMSESVGVFKKKNIYETVDYVKINRTLNKLLLISDKCNWRKSPINMDIFWKDTKRGILIEEYINVIYELKVFVVFGEPVIADLRDGESELNNIDYIRKENKYLNWDKEYELLSKFAKDLKIDFMRVDFLYDGCKLYASEFSPMPGTILPYEIEELIANKLRMPYLKHYYPNLVMDKLIS